MISERTADSLGKVDFSHQSIEASIILFNRCLASFLSELEGSRLTIELIIEYSVLKIREKRRSRVLTNLIKDKIRPKRDKEERVQEREGNAVICNGDMRSRSRSRGRKTARTLHKDDNLRRLQSVLHMYGK